MTLDQQVAQIVRDAFDGTTESVNRALREIGKTLRAALPTEPDPRQIRMFEEAEHG